MGGLMDYKFRMYSPTLGRFISPDNVVPDGQNPQAFNRYSYVMNSPILYNDPTGHCIEDLCIGELTLAAFWIGANADWLIPTAITAVLTIKGGYEAAKAGDVEGVAQNVAMVPIIAATGASGLSPANELSVNIDVEAAQLELESQSLGEVEIADGSQTYRVYTEGRANWKPTSADKNGDPPGLSCSVGCEGMSYKDIFKMTLNREPTEADSLYAVDTSTLEKSKFGLESDPIDDGKFKNPYHAVTGGRLVNDWTGTVEKQFKQLWTKVWSFGD
jgi:RHS repeat-associated protein